MIFLPKQLLSRGRIEENIPFVEALIPNKKMHEQLNKALEKVKWCRYFLPYSASEQGLDICTNLMANKTEQECERFKLQLRRRVFKKTSLNRVKSWRR